MNVNIDGPAQCQSRSQQDMGQKCSYIEWQCSGGPIDIHHHIHIDIVDPPRLA